MFIKYILNKLSTIKICEIRVVLKQQKCLSGQLVREFISISPNWNHSVTTGICLKYFNRNPSNNLNYPLIFFLIYTISWVEVWKHESTILIYSTVLKTLASAHFNVYSIYIMGELHGKCLPLWTDISVL